MKERLFKKLSFFLAAVMVMTSLWVPAMAETVEIEDTESPAPEVRGDTYYDDKTWVTFECDLDQDPLLATIVGVYENHKENLSIPSIIYSGDYAVRVTEIKQDSFKNDTDLTGTLTIEGGTTEGNLVIHKAFNGCTGLTEIKLGKYTPWDNEAFKGCSNVVKFTNDGSDPFDLSVLGGVRTPDPSDPDDDRTTYHWYDSKGTLLTEGEISNGTAIREDSIEEKGDKKYQDPDSKFWFTINEDGETATIVRKNPVDETNIAITPIDEDLEVPAEVKEGKNTYIVTAVGESAFQYAGYTGKVILPENLHIIGYKAFKECYITGDVVCPDDLEIIGDEAFSGCDKLDGTIDLGKSLVTLGDGAFLNCIGLNGNIVFPDTLKSIGKEAFMGCTGFGGTITFGKGLKTIGKDAFAGSSNHRTDMNFTGGLSFPEGLTAIGAYAFCDNKKLNGPLNLGKSLVTISDHVFENCYGLTGPLVIPPTVTSIENYAFSYCQNLTGNIDIPEGVTTVGEASFEYCKSFSDTLRLPSTLLSLAGDNKGEETQSTFLGCTGIKRVINNSENCAATLSPMEATDHRTWTDPKGNVIKSVLKDTAYRDDFEGTRAGLEEDEVSMNKPAEVKEETVLGKDGTEFKVRYPHKIPFFGKAKLNRENLKAIFGEEFKVSVNGVSYNVVGIKVNKKKKYFQITKLEDPDGMTDKKLNKLIKKATKGKNGLKFEFSPYYIQAGDKIKVKFKTKKDGTIIPKWVKVMIYGKFYTFKNSRKNPEVIVYNPTINVFTLKSSEVEGYVNGPQLQ